jgi:hypothetical protein
MRHLISGLVAAVAVMAAAPAMACGYSPCAQQVYVPEVSYSGCNPCGGWAHERLADPEQQYYYVNQGPTYTGPGNFAPYRTYREGYVSGRHGYGYGGYHGGYNAPHSYGGGYGYHRRAHYYHTPRVNYNYGGYAPRHYGYARHHGYAPHYSARYAAPYHYGHRVLRRYY